MLTFDHVVPVPLASHITKGTVWSGKYTLVKGEYYCALAPSGKGKSTFLHIACGLRDDYSGKVSWDNRDIKTLDSDERARMRRNKLAVVFQDLRLFAQLSAEENIMLKARLTQFPETEIRFMAEALGISALLNKPCGILSMGQQQRVAIVRALCQPFDMLLLDEPVSHLDRENAAKVLSLCMEKARQNGAGIVMSSLNQEDIPAGFQQILI